MDFKTIEYWASSKETASYGAQVTGKLVRPPVLNYTKSLHLSKKASNNINIVPESLLNFVQRLLKLN